MDPVDQGTLAMLLFGGGMALIATLYFTVRWYYKRKSKSPATNNKFKKQRLKQTFSRFSAVDEELVKEMHLFLFLLFFSLFFLQTMNWKLLSLTIQTLFIVTRAGAVPCGDRKTFPCT